MSRYSYEQRKYIVSRISNIKVNSQYIHVFSLLSDNEKNFCIHNEHGVFMDFSKVGDETLSKINSYLDSLPSTQTINNIPRETIDFRAPEKKRTYKLSVDQRKMLNHAKLNH